MVLSRIGFPRKIMVYCVYVMFMVLMIFLNAHNIHWRFYIVIKSTNCVHIDSLPPLNIPTIGIIEGPSRRNLTTLR
jgi:hypothetical protein